MGRAGELELSFVGGQTFPTFAQTFRYDPGPVVLPIPGVGLEQAGEFTLDAKSGLALSGAATWYFVQPVGLEARLDTEDLDLRTQGARYRVRVDLPPPLTDVTTDLDLGSGVAEVQPVRPFSLNLKLRTPGPVRLTVSGGLSYLSSLEVSTTQTVALGVVGVTPDFSGLEVGQISMRARALPADEDQGKLGWNGGAGLQIGLGPRVALVVEGRYFRFKRRTLVWERADSRLLSAIEQALLAQVRSRLQPVEFEPEFVHAVGGIAISF